MAEKQHQTHACGIKLGPAKKRIIDTNFKYSLQAKPSKFWQKTCKGAIAQNQESRHFTLKNCDEVQVSCPSTNVCQIAGHSPIYLGLG